MRRRTGNMLTHASGTVVLIATSVKKTRDKVCEITKEFDKYHVKVEEPSWVDEGKSISAKELVQEVQALLGLGRDILVQLRDDNEQ